MVCCFSFSIKFLPHHHQNPWNTDRSISMSAPKRSSLLLVWIQMVKKWSCAIVGNLTEKIFLLSLREMGEYVWPVSVLDLYVKVTISKTFNCDCLCFVWFRLNKQYQCKLITEDCNRCEINMNKCYFSYLCLLVLLCYYYTVLGYLNVCFKASHAHWGP